MERILAIFSKQKVQPSFVDFACYLSKEIGSALTGVFIESPYERFSMEMPPEPELFKEISSDHAVKEPVTQLAQNIQIIKDRCLQNHVSLEVHQDNGEPVQEALEESRYTDLIVVDPRAYCFGEEDDLPSHFVKHLLSNAACPVILAPENFEGIDELIFVYDGSDSSLFAIKQFTYLFPQLNHLKALLLEIHLPHQETPLEGHRRTFEWFQIHYPDFSHEKLNGHIQDALFVKLRGQKKKFVIIGGYGRKVLPHFFHRNEANILTRAIDLPLFITHY